MEKILRTTVKDVCKSYPKPGLRSTGIVDNSPGKLEIQKQRRFVPPLLSVILGNGRLPGLLYITVVKSTEETQLSGT